MIEATARGTALAVLHRVETRGAYANLALADALARSPLAARDRAFCTELVYGTLRSRARLDHLLDQVLSRPLLSLSPQIRNLLRLSLYQLEFLPDVASYGVVDEAVTLAKQHGHAGVASLTNAVLRNFIRQRSALVLPEPGDPVAYLSVALSHPAWLAERWLTRLGSDEAFALALADNQPSHVCLRLNTLRAKSEQVIADLAAVGVRAELSALVPEGIRLEAGRAVERLPGYDEGLFLAQDEGAVLVGHAVSPKAGETILDLCAAPGGKATHLAALASDRARILALDVHDHKARLIRENCRRLGVRSVTVVVADAREYWPKEQGDAVLVDAPCTGTGTLRRRPDLRWRRTPRDLAELVLLQQALLASAASMVRRGGRLVYSTCSLEPEENEGQIRWFLGSFLDFKPGDLRRHLPPTAAALCGDEPWLYLWPHKQGTDGFFICRLERRGEGTEG